MNKRHSIEKCAQNIDMANLSWCINEIEDKEDEFLWPPAYKRKEPNNCTDDCPQSERESDWTALLKLLNPIQIQCKCNRLRVARFKANY